MLREMAEALEALTAAILLVLEDLQWSDYATLDLISSLARRRKPARLLVIGTYRPADVTMSRHPLKAVKQELEVHGQCAELPLGLLTVADVAAYLRGRFAGETQPAVPVRELAQLIRQRTDGNPLFMVNVADSLVARGIIREQEGRWQLQVGMETVEVEVPESLRQLIEQQVEHLPQEEQQVLEAASVVGVEFSAAAAAAALEADREQIEARCEGLARRGQFLRSLGVDEWPDGTVTIRYGFAHALYQNVVYQRVAATRCMRLHQRIGERIEAAYGNRVGQVAAELAVHFERGRDYRRAVRYLEQAGQRAAERSANVEAIAHLTKGLELLTSLPDTLERTQQELGLQTTIGPALQAIKGLGAPEVVRAYTRARELCQQVGETPQLFETLWGLFLTHTVRGEIPQALELINELLRMAQQQGDPDLLLQAHHAAWGTMTWLGEYASAITHAEQGIAIYSPEKHRLHAMRYGGHDPGVCGHAQGALALWLRGYGDQAMVHSQQALDLARHLSHPPSLVHALTWRLWLHQFRREPNAVREWANAMVAVAVEQGLAQSLLFATLLRGWALSVGGHTEEGIAPLQAGVEKYQSMGAAMLVGYFKALLAEAYSRAGLAAQGLSELDGALEYAQRTGERFWEAEIHRLKGELVLQFGVRSPKSETLNTQHLTPNTQEVEACFLKAIEVARKQSAKSLELRATVSLARLWQRQGKQHAARNILSEIYGWFTEGFDTADLQEAKALLQELDGQGREEQNREGLRRKASPTANRRRANPKRMR
jgi:predicted ATPase